MFIIYVVVKILRKLILYELLESVKALSFVGDQAVDILEQIRKEWIGLIHVLEVKLFLLILVKFWGFNNLLSDFKYRLFANLHLTNEYIFYNLSFLLLLLSRQFIFIFKLFNDHIHNLFIG